LRATTAFAPLQPTFPRTNSPVAPNIEGGVEQLQFLKHWDDFY